MTFWTDEREAILKAAAIEGLSFSEMGRRVGCTRNAAQGKCYRLGIVKPGGPRNNNPRGFNGQATRAMAPPTLPKQERPPKLSGRIRCEDLKSHMCRWPIGDPQEPDFTFCGQQKERGSYCAKHAAIAYTGAPPAPKGRQAEPSRLRRPA